MVGGYVDNGRGFHLIYLPHTSAMALTTNCVYGGGEEKTSLSSPHYTGDQSVAGSWREPDSHSTHSIMQTFENSTFSGVIGDKRSDIPLLK